MVAATKNKRGRPAGFPDHLYSEFWEKSKRAAQNTYYAILATSAMDQDTQEYFLKDGVFRRQGIAEKIGRMLKAGKISDQEAGELARECMKSCQEGHKAKEVEAVLARMARKAQPPSLSADTSGYQ